MNAKPDGNQASSEQQEMPLIEHLLELRNRLLKMVLAVIICFAVIYPFANDLYLLLSQPLRELLPVGQMMIATDITSPFFAPLKLALVLAVFAAIPVILYQLWSFVRSEEHTSELQSRPHLVCRLLLEKKNQQSQ